MAGFGASDVIIESEVYVGGQEHFYMETQCCVAVPRGEDGEMDIFSSTQFPIAVQVVSYSIHTHCTCMYSLSLIITQPPRFSP